MWRMGATTSDALEGIELQAWRSYLKSHASILRELDAELGVAQGITTRDYEVLLHLAQAPDRKLAMSALAEGTMLTRSGITRLIDGLVAAGFVERVSCPSDARVSFARLTNSGYAKLEQSACTHVNSIRRMFLERYTATELEHLADLLGRLPGCESQDPCTPG
jgi:DNA-binding MarR family transcriptional regulator